MRSTAAESATSAAMPSPAELGRRAVCRRRVEVVHDDRRALVAKPPSDGKPEAAGRTRDQSDLPTQSIGHGPTF
jgi:hypothetical protein